MKPLILIIALVVLTGCEVRQQEQNEPSKENLTSARQYSTYEDTIRGHVYLIAVQWSPQGFGLGGPTHAEHCQCKGGGK